MFYEPWQDPLDVLRRDIQLTKEIKRLEFVEAAEQHQEALRSGGSDLTLLVGALWFGLDFDA